MLGERIYEIFLMLERIRFEAPHSQGDLITLCCGKFPGEGFEIKQAQRPTVEFARGAMGRILNQEGAVPEVDRAGEGPCVHEGRLQGAALCDDSLEKGNRAREQGPFRFWQKRTGNGQGLGDALLLLQEATPIRADGFGRGMNGSAGRKIGRAGMGATVGLRGGAARRLAKGGSGRRPKAEKGQRQEKNDRLLTVFEIHGCSDFSGGRFGSASQSTSLGQDEQPQPHSVFRVNFLK